MAQASIGEGGNAGVVTSTPPGGNLKTGVLRLPGVLMQSVTGIAPAIAGLFTVQFIVINAGVTAPLAYFGAFIIALMLGYVLAQFAKHLSSTGSYYTFVSRSLGGRAGFLVAWVYLLFYPVVGAQAGTFLGYNLQTILKAEYGWNVQWWWFMIFLVVLMAVTAWRGVELSVNLLIGFGIVEAVIVLILAVWGFASPGAGGVNLNWLVPSHAPNFHGLFLGVVFAIFAITGWDAAAPLAEESREPKKTIPRAVLGSILIMGVFLVLVSWGQITGWGTDHIGSFSSSGVLPAIVLSKHYWGGGWWLLILFATLNSVIAVSIACTNAAVRFLYGMSRGGALPVALQKIHPRFKTPSNAIILQTGINVALGLVLPLLIGVANVYNVTGTWFTFALAFVYVMANIGLCVFYRRQHPDEFSWFKHLVIPGIGSVALIVVCYYSVVPLPAWPVSLAPFIVLGWLIVGAVTMAIIYRGPRARNLAMAGVAMGEATEQATEERFLAHGQLPPPDTER
jgi:amino acid transporter